MDDPNLITKIIWPAFQKHIDKQRQLANYKAKQI